MSTLKEQSTYQRPQGHGLKKAPAIHHIRTQKGRGVVAIAQGGFKVPAFGIVQEVLDIPRVLQALFPNGYVDEAFEVFARPMPLTPQHGFVDSRIARSSTELMAIWEETRKLDPQGEMMLMRPISADYNMILHPGALIIGRGHDGATAGTGCVTIPLIGACGPDWRQLATAATVGPQDWPFFELVLDGKETWFTQLRGGPAMPFGDDFVPKALVGKAVTKVVHAEGDLVEWKTICHGFAQHILNGGVVAVDHTGGSLGSHYGVHCIENNIPIFTKLKPEVNMVLPETMKIPDHGLDALRTGIVAGTLVNLAARERRSVAVQFVLLALHSAPRMREHNSYWFGAACSIMHRLGVAAALGEWRHAGSLAKGGGMSAVFHGQSRDAVYDAAFPAPFPHRKLLPAAYHSFKHGSWGGGFGGKKWAECAGSIVELDEAIMAAMLKPSQKTAAALVGALNEAVNKAHNNGWWMNKFINASAFDRAAKHSHTTYVEALPVVMELLHIGNRQADLLMLSRRWLLTRDLDKDPERIKSLVLAHGGTADEGQLHKLAKQGHANPLGIQIPEAQTITHVQGKLLVKGPSGSVGGIHFQYKTEINDVHGSYNTHDWAPPGGLSPEIVQAIQLLPVTKTLAGGDTVYYLFPFEVLDKKVGVFTLQIKLGNGVVLHTAQVKAAKHG